MKCNAKSFVDMYEKIYIDLYRFALCLMKNQTDAEDAVGDAVLIGYENIEKLKKPEAFKSWMFTILANTCKKKLMASAKQLEIQQKVENKDCDTGIFEQDFDLSLDLQKAFHVLSEEEQLIIGLSVFGGYDSTEIGKILKIKPTTIRSKRSRALGKMKIVLD